MIITCEHCGTAIDVNKKSRCPNCGASYARNKEYLEQHKINKDFDNRDRDATIKQKEVTNEILTKNQEQAEKQFKFASKIFIVSCIIFAFIFIVAIAFIFFTITKFMNN